MPRGSRRWGWLKLLVGVSILGFLFTRASPEAVVRALGSSRAGPIAAAFALALASQVPAAFRLRLFAGSLGLEFPVARLLAINLAAAFYGLFVPGGNVTAGAVRVYRLSRGEGSPGRAVLAVVRDRLDATAALVAVGLLFLLADGSGGPRETRLLVGGVLACGAIFAFLACWGRVHARPGEPPGEGAWAGRRLPETARLALAETGRMPLRAQGRAFALSLATQLAGVAAYLLVARSVGIELPLVTLGWIRSAVMLATMLPVSLGGIGVREGAFLLLLAPYGVSQEAALALSLLVFATTLAGVATLGGLLEAGGLLTRGAAEVRGTAKGSFSGERADRAARSEDGEGS